MFACRRDVRYGNQVARIRSRVRKEREKEKDFMRMDHFFTDATISSSSGNNNEQKLVPTNRMS